VRQQDTNPPHGGRQLKLCATLSPPLPSLQSPLFPSDGNISPYLGRWCLYVAYWKLLKLTAASNAGVYEKLVTSSIWSITAGSNVPSTIGRYAYDCVHRRLAIHKCRSATHHWSSVCDKWYYRNTKKCNIILHIMDSPEGGGLPPVTYIFESSRQADVKL